MPTVTVQEVLREYDDAIESIMHRQVADLVTECRRLEALLREESRVSAARFHALNEVRAIVNLPKSDTDPIPGLADAVRAAVRPSAVRTDAPQCAPKLPSADQLAAIVGRYEAARGLLSRHGGLRDRGRAGHREHRRDAGGRAAGRGGGWPVVPAAWCAGQWAAGLAALDRCDPADAARLRPMYLHDR